MLSYPPGDVDLLCVNETEGAALTGQMQHHELMSTALAAMRPVPRFVLTLGAAGDVVPTRAAMQIRVAAEPRAVDTTAAGDTFLGYYLASRAAGLRPARVPGRWPRAPRHCASPGPARWTRFRAGRSAAVSGLSLELDGPN